MAQRFVRAGIALIGAVAMIQSALAQQASVPSVRIGTAALISPSAADTYYGSSTTSTNGMGATTRPPEIVELARALKNSPDLIYEYVHNNIDVVWMYGLHKGALGTSIDKAGTSYDQTMLMVELLRQAGYTASYKQGTITLTGAQFTAWSGISDATAACQLLASGGIPGAVNGTSDATCAYGAGTAISSVQLAHVWVSVTISGTAYVFDPAYKAHAWKPGINLASAMGMTSGQPLAQAMSGYTAGVNSGVNFANNFNAENLNTTLAGYGTNLLNYLQANNLTAAELEDIIGGGKIDPYISPTGGLRQATLPYTNSTLKTWTGNVPDQYRATLRVLGEQVNPYISGTWDLMFDRTFFADEVYGRRMVVDTDYGTIHAATQYYNNIALRVDGVAVATFQAQPLIVSGLAASPRGLATRLHLTANHPYASSASGTATADGTYMDAAVTKPIYIVTAATIVHSWGDVGANLLTKWDQEVPQDQRTAFKHHYSKNAQGEPQAPDFTGFTGDNTRTRSSAMWLAQQTRAARLHSSIAKSVVQLHHSLGTVYAHTTLVPEYAGGWLPPPPPDFVIKDSFDRIDVDSAISVTSKTADAVARRAAVHAIAATSAALEGSIAGQIGDVPDMASVATRFEWGNRPVASEDPYAKGVRDFLEVTAANFNAMLPLVQVEGRTSYFDGAVPAFTPLPYLGDDEIQNWRNVLAVAVNAYTQAGFTVFTSRDSFLGPGQRGGPYWYQNIVIPESPGDPQGAFRQATKQRGGALVANKYVNGEPVEIAHVSLAQRIAGGAILTKGGGGGAQPDAASTYAPTNAGDVLKARFVDRSDMLGVNLSNGSLSAPSPVSLSVGSGEFPYKLTAGFTFRSGPKPSTAASAIVPFEPRSGGWIGTWENKLSLSGSGMEALGQSDVRAAVGAIVAFSAAQDTYKAAPSLAREISAVLTQSWWIKQLSGNVATVTVGASTRQFVRLFDGTWVSSGGGYATLVQNGARAPVAERCQGQLGVYYPMSRVWDNSSLAFNVTNANGDRQHFAYWRNYYKDGSDSSLPCMSAQGFRLTSWTFPQGITVNLTYAGSDPTSTYPPTLDRLTQVSNSLGRTLTFPIAASNSITVSAGTRTISLSNRDNISVPSTQTDSLGNVTTYAITATPTANARTGGALFVTSVTTPDNTSKPNLTYTYDVFGRVKEIKDAVAIQQQSRGPYQFLIADGTRGERIDPAGGSFVVTYDTSGRPSRYTDEIGRVTQAFHDGRGRIKRYVYPELDEEQIDYDDRNNPTKLTKKPKPSACTPACPLDQVIEAAWHTTWNKPLWVRDQLGRQSDFTYYDTGAGKSLLATALRPAVATTRPQYSFAYDAIGKPLTATDPTGLLIQTTHNGLGNLTSTVVDPGAGHVASTTTFAYDADGNVTQTTDPRGNISTVTYDANRRKLVETAYLGAMTAAPIGAATRTTYDAVGRVTKEERATVIAGTTITWGHVTQVAYTPTGQKSQTTDADGRVVRMQYDAADRLIVTIDPENRRVRNVYDLAGQLLQEIRADASPLQQVYAERSYTPNGKEAWVKDARGNQTTYAYDGFDRLRRATFPDATYEEVSYDVMGNVVSKLTRGGQLIQNTFDSLDRMVTHLVPQPGAAPAILTTTSYDLAGRPTGISDNTGHSLSYGFDTAMRVTSVTQAAPTFTGTRVVAYQLDAAGNRTRTTWADGYYVNYAYDQLNRTTTATENGTFLLATYVYNPLGRRTSLVYGNGASQGYTYSTQGDLLTLASTLTGTSNTTTNTYTKAHQIAGETASNTAWRYVPSAFQTTAYSPANNLNQYVNITVGANPTATMSYDANGNLTGDGVWTLAYDAKNMLRASNKAGMTVSYAYDPLGRRQAKTANAVTTTFLHDGDEEIADYSAANAVLRRFIPGPGTDMPIAMVTPGAPATRAYFHTNRQGSTVAMSGTTGAIAEGPYTYDAYGNGAATTGVPFKFTGRRLDPETGFYYYRARYYSPGLGRFLQTDPVGDQEDVNLYAYVENDPLNETDPSGACPMCIPFAIFLLKEAAGEAFEQTTGLPAPTVKGAVKFAAKQAAKQTSKQALRQTLGNARSGIWKLDPKARGIAIEKSLAKKDYRDWYNVGASKNGKFPLVDFQKGNNLVSLKTVDTAGSSWRGEMKGHIDDLARRGGMIDGKPANMILDIRVQPGGVDAAKSLIDYGRAQGIIVRIKEFQL